jgi:hypothetical protein
VGRASLHARRVKAEETSIGLRDRGLPIQRQVQVSKAYCVYGRRSDLAHERRPVGSIIPLQPELSSKQNSQLKSSLCHYPRVKAEEYWRRASTGIFRRAAGGRLLRPRSRNHHYADENKQCPNHRSQAERLTAQKISKQHC